MSLKINFVCLPAAITDAQKYNVKLSKILSCDQISSISENQKYIAEILFLNAAVEKNFSSTIFATTTLLT